MDKSSKVDPQSQDNRGLFSFAKKGYGVNLYRDKDNNMIAGVCAGIARNLDIDAGIVRILFVIGLFFTGGSLVWAYLIAWILISKQPRNAQINYIYNEEKKSYQPAKIFSYPKSSKERVQAAASRMDRLSKRIESLEKHLTSKRYQLEKEFRDL